MVVYLHVLLTSQLDGVVCVTSHPARYTTGGKAPGTVE